MARRFIVIGLEIEVLLIDNELSTTPLGKIVASSLKISLYEIRLFKMSFAEVRLVFKLIDWEIACEESTSLARLDGRLFEAVVDLVALR